MRCLLLLFICASVAIAKEICCDDEIGCFNDDPPFDSLPLPTCPHKIGVIFRMYDRSHTTKKKAELLTRYKIANIWKPYRRTVFIVHGFMNGENAPWMSSFKDEFLIREDYNVIIVGWSGGSRHVWYPSSATNVRTVGAEIALVANNLLKVGGTTPEKLYCIGHSLGGHACGHAGMRSQFHRVTGLDPAGPWFENKPWEIGLNPSSAEHVDAIHTNGEPGISLVLNLGTMKPLGDVDFYPNGGGSQPGCYIDVFGLMPDVYDDNITSVTETEASNGKLDASETGMVAGIGLDGFVRTYPGGEEGVAPHGGIMPHCSHMRVLDLYEESINNPSAFTSAHSCINNKDVPGSCSECLVNCPVMGYHAEQHWFVPEKLALGTQRPLFWLETNRKSPYSQT